MSKSARVGCQPYARRGDSTVFRKIHSSQLRRHLPVDDVHSGHPEPVRVVQQPSPSFACNVIEPQERNSRHVAPRLVEAPVRWKERKEKKKGDEAYEFIQHSHSLVTMASVANAAWPRK